MKRIGSVLLALLILVGMIPAMALAEENATTLESVQVNQVGYIVGLTKTFVVARTVDDDTAVAFELVDAADKVVYTGTMQKEETPYKGTANEWPSIYYTGDFTDFDTPGKYSVRVACGTETLTSPTFSIGGTDIYAEALNAILSYMRGERDFGRSIGGKDNRYTQNQYNNNEIIDLHGGWYDASNRPAVYMGYVDNYNYMVCNIESNTSYQLFAAYEANRAYYDNFDYNHNGTSDILEEAAWGCDWYVRLKPQAITDGYFYNGPEHNKIHSNESVKTPVSIRMGAGTAIAALAKAVRYGLDGEYTHTQYGENAKQAWDWYIQNNADKACEDEMEHLMDDIYWALAAIEMYETFGEQQYLTKAQESVDKILARQSADDNFSGWFELGMEEYNQKGEGGPYHNWLDEAAVLYPLIGYATLQAEDADRVEKIKTAVAAYMDFKLTVANNSGANPYGYAKQYFRHDVADENSTLTRFFQYETGRPTSAGPVTNGWVSGENGRLLSLLYAGLLADDFLGTDKYLDYGLNQLNWVYGVNPFYAVMQSGIGEGRNLAEEIGHGGSVPYGGFINGIRGDYKNKIEYETGYTDSKDIPFIDQSYWTGEWFLPIGTDGLVALSKLMGMYGEEVTLPKDTPIELETQEYLLTTELGSNMSQTSFSVQVSNLSNASGGQALTGVDEPLEGVILTGAPAATGITLRYAAEKDGTLGVYVNGKRQTLYYKATGGKEQFEETRMPVQTKKGDTLSIQCDGTESIAALDTITFTDTALQAAADTTVTTLVGTAPLMPQAVDVTYTDGRVGKAEVRWEEIPTSAYAQRGQFPVQGKLTANDTPVKGVVDVYALTDGVRIRPAYLAVGIGGTPVLPDKVELGFENGAGLLKEVVWEEIPANKLAQAGEVVVTGQVDGVDIPAMAYIAVMAAFPENTSDIAYRQLVQASSDDGTNLPHYINDGDLSTRWASGSGDQHQWVEIDLGTKQAIAGIELNWEGAFAKEYTLSVSDDRRQWSEIYTTDESDGQIDALSLEEITCGRYLRLDCEAWGHATWRGYSLYDWSVTAAPYAEFFVPAGAITLCGEKRVLSELKDTLQLTPVFTPADTSFRTLVWRVSELDGSQTDKATINQNGVLTAQKNGFVKVTATAVDGSGCVGEYILQIMGQPDELNSNLALHKTATSVGGYGDGNPAANAVDGNPTTRWSGVWGKNDHILQVDLEKETAINRMKILWEAAYSKAYTVEVSSTGTEGDWTVAYTLKAGQGGTDVLEFPEVKGRYIRLCSTAAAMPQYGISIWEFEVAHVERATVTATHVADTLKQITVLPAHTMALALPAQNGYEITLVDSSNTDVIAADGSVTTPAKDTDVTLTLSVESTTDPTDTATAEVTLTVKGVTADRMALATAIANGKAVDPVGYTPDSIKTLSRALAWGRLVQADATAGRQEVAAVTVAMEAALAGLEESKRLCGDVNCSGGVTAEDALLALQIATHKVTANDTQTLAADVDGNPGVTANDALLILQHATKKITAFPVEG